MRWLLTSLFSIQAVGFCHASPACAPQYTQVPSASVIYQHPSPADAWLEVATNRNNGDILVTRYDAGEIWEINTETGEGSLAYRFPESSGINSTVGISQYQNDVFAFVGGQTQGGLSGGFPSYGTWGVYSLDLRGREPSVSLIASIPESQLLNGLTVINPKIQGRQPRGTPIILVAESSTGSIYAIDTSTNNTSLFYNGPLLTPPAENAYPNGINGLKVPPVEDPDYVYFTVGGHGTFYRLAIDGRSGQPVPGAEPELLLDEETALDDFILDNDRTAYIANVGGAKIIRLTENGKRSVFIEGDIVASATSTVLVEEDGKNVLYVSAGSRGASLEESSPGRLIKIVS